MTASVSNWCLGRRPWKNILAATSLASLAMTTASTGVLAASEASASSLNLKKGLQHVRHQNSLGPDPRRLDDRTFHDLGRDGVGGLAPGIPARARQAMVPCPGLSVLPSVAPQVVKSTI